MRDGRTARQHDRKLFRALTHAEHSWLAAGRTGSGCNDGDASLSVVTTTLEEFGHNFFGLIDYENDQCGADDFHDIYGLYSMDGEDCGSQDDQATYYHPSGPSHRWNEAKNHVLLSTVESECTDQDVNNNDHLACPSPGDLNNGLAGKGP